MNNLIITLDIRCCNEQNVDIEIFKQKINDYYNKYEIHYTLGNSNNDKICNSGHIHINLENGNGEMTEEIAQQLYSIFKSLISK